MKSHNSGRGSSGQPCQHSASESENLANKFSAKLPFSPIQFWFPLEGKRSRLPPVFNTLCCALERESFDLIVKWSAMMIEATHISKVLNVVCCADEWQRRLDLPALQHFLWLKAVRFMARGEKYLQISISCVSSVYLKRLTYTHSGHTGIKEQWIQESTQSQVTRKAQGPPRPSST